MKKALSLTCTIILLSATSFSLASASTLNSYNNTTTEVIEFYDIQWGASRSEFLAKLDSFNIPYEKKGKSYGNNLINTFSSSYGDGTIIPVTYSEHVETYCYDIYPIKLSAAGYDLLSLDAFFYGNSLFEINISLEDHDLLSAAEQFDDLKNKLTNLYGEPYFYQEEENSFTGDRFEYTVCVWLGSNSTAVYLKRSKNLVDASGIFSNSDRISLHYGLTSVTDIFEEVDTMKQETAEQHEEQERETIANDYSGL